MNNILRRALTLLFIFTIEVGSCFAAAVSIQIVQHSKNDRIFEATQVIEESMMNALFDSGCVVSNSPIKVSSSEEDDKTIAQKGNDDAFYGSLKYCIAVYVDFVDDSTNPEAALLGNIKSITCKVYDVKKGLELSTRTFNVNRNFTGGDSASRLSKFASDVALKVYSDLNNKR